VTPFTGIPVAGFPVGAPPILVPRPLAPVRHVRWTTADHGEQDAANSEGKSIPLLQIVMEFRGTEADHGDAT